MAKLPESAIKLIDGKNFATLATLMPDGSPHVSVTWIDRDGDTILINTSRGRLKEKNIEKDKRVAVCVYDSSNPYSAVFIRGTVKEVTENGAREHIDRLSMKYTGKKYPADWLEPGEKRVMLRIEPLHITMNG